MAARGVNGRSKCGFWRTFRGDRKGTTAIEFAVVSPAIFALFLGIAEVSQAISTQMTVQAATRAGVHFGLTKPPVQGNVQPVIDSVRATLPAEWSDQQNASRATVTAAIFCECEIAGPAACGVPCGQGDRSQTFLRVDVAKPYEPLVELRFLSPSLTLTDTSMVRLQ